MIYETFQFAFYKRLNKRLTHDEIISIIYSDINNNLRENLFVIVNKMSYLLFNKFIMKFMTII